MKHRLGSSPQAENVFRELHRSLAEKTDLLFAKLFVFQWLAGIVLALWVSNTQLYLAIFLGAALAALPILLSWRQPGRPINRLVVAASQMGFSILYTHLTTGRIETHFHILGSMAFLAIYRDLRPLVVATFITAIDHFLRGAFWPESIYGVRYASPMRAVEHTAWVLFEDGILYLSIKLSIEEMRALANYAQDTILKTSKLSEIGKLAGNIVHEINNPVGIIQGKAKVILKRAQVGTLTPELMTKDLERIIAMTERLAKIVSGMKAAVRPSELDEMTTSSLAPLFDQSISLFKHRLDAGSVRLSVQSIPDASIKCRTVQIEQVLIVLLNNSADAIAPLTEKWIDISFSTHLDTVEIRVTDSGNGIPNEILKKMMQPFFTTKPEGQGTGLGLSIARDIVEQHRGTLAYDATCSNTRFVITLPIEAPSTAAQPTTAKTPQAA